MALVLVLMLAFHGVHSASLPVLPNSLDSTEERSDALTDPSDGSDTVLDALAARLDASDTLDTLTQEASDRLSDFSSSKDAQSDELRTDNPLDNLASKLDVLPDPLEALDSIIDTLGSDKVRRSVLEDVKQLIETKFSALIEDGVKRIAGKKGILKKGLSLKPSSRSSLVLKVKGKDQDSSSEELESQNSGMIKEPTDGSFQDSGETEMRNVVDELLREEEDRTIEKDISDSNEDRLNIEKSMGDKDPKTIEDYDDTTAESSRAASYEVEKNLSNTNTNKDKTIEVEKILDLDEILKLALKDLSGPLSQENVKEDNDKDLNLTTELDAKNSQSDKKSSEIEKPPQETNESEGNVENILRQGKDFVENDDDDTQAYKASNIDIDENVLQTERSSSTQNEHDGQNPAKLLNLGNLILGTKNKTLSILKTRDENTHLKTSQPSESDKLIDAYQSLNIKENSKSGDLKHDDEQNDLNKISGPKKYADLEELKQPENQNEVKAFHDKNESIKGETKHTQQQQVTQPQVKKHHHHHHHYHHHHHQNNNKPSKMVINTNNSDDILMSKADATQEQINSGELKSYNTEKKPNHPKHETEEEEDNNDEESKKGLEEENDFKYEENNVTKERKSILEENKKSLEVNNVSTDKTSDNEPELENETSETRTATKHTPVTREHSQELGEERSNAEDLTQEIYDSRSGIGEIIYITDDSEKLNLNIAKGRQGTEGTGFAEKDIKGTEEDATAEDRSGCHSKKHHKQKGRHENDETNVLQDLIYNKDKIKSYTLSVTFTTTK